MNKMFSYSEEELVFLLKGGSQDAFGQLFGTYSPKLYRFALSYLKTETDAEEIVQEVFLKLWERHSSLKNEKSFQSYLFTIAFNAIKNKFNRKMREEKYKHELFELFSCEKPTLESKLNFEKLLDKLDFYIDQLPEKRKKVFLKRKKEGKSIDMIASEMGISPKTVKNQITEAMKSLKKSFDNEDISTILFYFLFVS